ncbi:hypothetical protein AX16_009980 [Volvariella volvacea WC 439]|nr:hypothetical protein AX16_009980 [Volvariella volvacea WC 439]
MWAIRERIKADKMATQMKDRGWTRTHGFFVQMGGLVRVRDNSTYDILPERVRGGRKMINQYKIPRISEREIKDHGKGDLLAKAIVVIQATWFVAQCIARHVKGLVVTEIELVTLAFATLNVITYGLWWDKPLNVEYPLYFDEEGRRVDGLEEKNVESWHREAWGNMKGYFLAWGGSSRWHGVVNTIWEKGIKALFLAIFDPLMDMMIEGDDDDRR